MPRGALSHRPRAGAPLHSGAREGTHPGQIKRMPPTPARAAFPQVSRAADDLKRQRFDAEPGARDSTAAASASR